jgi:hypothetical protein
MLELLWVGRRFSDGGLQPGHVTSNGSQTLLCSFSNAVKAYQNNICSSTYVLNLNQF